MLKRKLDESASEAGPSDAKSDSDGAVSEPAEAGTTDASAEDGDGARPSSSSCEASDKPAVKDG